jgi:hypothetical protein
VEYKYFILPNIVYSWLLVFMVNTCGVYVPVSIVIYMLVQSANIYVHNSEGISDNFTAYS